MLSTQRRQDYLVTFLTEFVVLGGSILVLKLAAVYWGGSGFGEFILGRRLIGLLQPAVLCGMGLAITRNVAMSRASQSGTEWPSLDGALLITSVTILLAAAFLLIPSRFVAAVFFGNGSLAPLSRALAPCVAGLVLHYIVYGVLRGRNASREANLLQAVNLGLLPLAAFAIPRLTAVTLLTVLGLGQMVVSLGVLYRLRRPGPAAESLPGIWREGGRELLRYGAPRVPGEFMLGALGTLPVTAAAHYGGPVLAGQVGLGLSLLTLVGSVFTPLGIIMLPSISGRVATGDVAGLGREVRRLTLACVGLTIVGTITLELLAPWALPLVFGPEFAAAVTPIRVIVLGAVPYVCYVILRNVLDAIHAAPLNAGNLAVGLLVQGAFLVLGRAAMIPVAIAAGMTTLGLMTLWRTVRVVHALTSPHPVPLHPSPAAPS